MLVDDSMVARAVLSRMVEAEGEFEIAAVAGTAEDAITALAHVEVDIVLLDLEMPGAGGLKSIPKILSAARGARVMIVSSMAEEGAEETVAALALGAADTLPKPGTGRFNGRFSEVLLGRLRALGHADGTSREASRDNGVRVQASGPVLRSMSSEPLKLLALGASTGGIHALGQFFQHLPRRIGVPILVTQHLPAAFMPVFARQLGVAAGRPALIAQDGMILAADTLFIAPGDAHLTVEETSAGLAIRLNRQSAASGCLPSVDPMFASAARVCGRHALGVVLTGMGRDGFDGATKLVACGGAVLAQDQDSCAVWGMPRVIADGGLAAAILPPDKLARRVASRCGSQ
ncbi:MAG: chemotaxis-specific protein-glutamate methyltransferase CheB [Sphingomicrobium sp.]|nr:chemotaxis-specific protein-glutamate methyltransferase CheB [Sphingomonadales bacterium]